MPTVSWRFERERELELRADAVGAGDEHRLAKALADLEQPAEAADARQHFGAQRALGERLDALDQRVAGVDVDTGIAIGKWAGFGRGHEGFAIRCARQEMRGGRPLSRISAECDGTTTIREVARARSRVRGHLSTRRILPEMTDSRPLPPRMPCLARGDADVDGGGRQRAGVGAAVAAGVLTLRHYVWIAGAAVVLVLALR